MARDAVRPSRRPCPSSDSTSLAGSGIESIAPGDSFAVVFAMLPVLLIDVVNQLRPLLLEVRAARAQPVGGGSWN